MKFILLDKSGYNLPHLLKLLGYSPWHRGYIRPLARGYYPRFHLFVRPLADGRYEFNLHLDQKKQSYAGCHMHSAVYEEDEKALLAEKKRLEEALLSLAGGAESA